MVYEEILVKNAIAGDKVSFEKLYEQIYADMYRIAYFMLGNVEDAKDAVSDATVDMYRYIRNLKSGEAFARWATKILWAKCKRKRKEYLNNDVPILEDLQAKGNVSDEVIRNVDLQKGLMQLEKTERMIVLLSAVYGYNSSDIGKILGMLPSTVRSKLKRSLTKLRERMDSYEG